MRKCARIISQSVKQHKEITDNIFKMVRNRIKKVSKILDNKSPFHTPSILRNTVAAVIAENKS